MIANGMKKFIKRLPNNIINLRNIISINDCNDCIKEVDFTIHGNTTLNILKYQKLLAEKQKLPFDKITYCNIGNQHYMGQKPISFYKDFMACVNSPNLLNQPYLFKSDLRKRAIKFMSEIPGGVGSYSLPSGVQSIRKDVSYYLSHRDGYSADFRDIFMLNGSTHGIKLMLKLLISNSNDYILLPEPMYPLYYTLIKYYNGKILTYKLDELMDWKIDFEHLYEKIHSFKKKGLNIKGFVAINPGNPTGSCLTLEDQQEIINLCRKERIVLLADEVYQENEYDSSNPFLSFKQVARDMENCHDLEMVSFNSVSHGFMGEAGRRGGYMELFNIDTSVRDILYKLLSMEYCANMGGQIAVSVMCRPPIPSEPSFEQFHYEKTQIIDSLKRRAFIVNHHLNSLPGIKSSDIKGSLYAFPRILLPEKAIAAAKVSNVRPDVFYCNKLLDETGIAVIPGYAMSIEDNNLYNNKNGNYYFRMTILPPENEIQNIMEKYKNFHMKFMEMYT